MTTNRWNVPCVRCQKRVLPDMGDIHHPPGFHPYVTCALCSLVEGVKEPVHVRELLTTFPRPDPFDMTKQLAPYAFQAEDAIRIASYRAHLVGSQQGTGKSPTAALGALRADCGNMIFCPASVKWNWVREIERWRPDLKPGVTLSRDLWTLPEAGEVRVSSWGLLPGDPCLDCKSKKLKCCSHLEPARILTPEAKDEEEKPFLQANPLPEIKRPLVLVADEIQYLQSARERQKRWDMLADAVWLAGGWLYGLTGTVLSNKPRDLLEILKRIKLDRAAFPGGEEQFLDIFRDWFMNKKGSRHAPRGESHEELLQALRPVRICRLRRHVLKHLPPVVEKQLDVELTKDTLHEVDEACQKLLAKRRSWEDVQSGVIPDPWKKRKALSEDERDRRDGLFEDRVRFYFETRPWVTDEELRSAVKEAIESRNETPAMTEIARIRSILSLAKVRAVLELVEQHEGAEEPLLVFCQHVRVLERLFDGRAGWGLYHGGVPQHERDKRVLAFQGGEIVHGLGISITAGGEGINLTRAGSMGFVDKHWNPAKNDQAAARVQRPGAEVHDNIRIYNFVANHAVDRLLMVTLAEKSELHRAVEDDEASMAGRRQ